MDFEKTFDNTSVGYDKSRPFYPEELYRDIFNYIHIGEQSDVLEIGLGTGKATRPFLEKHCRLIGIEPGENMAGIARERFRNHSNFTLCIDTLQNYVCPSESFDFIFSATAFHWIPEEYGYKRVYELLKPGGAFARFAYHAGPDRKRKALADDIRELYELYMPTTRPQKEFGEEDAERTAAIAVKYGFADAEYRLYRFTKDFTADEYMELLKTYPNHMALERESREKLFGGIHSAISHHGGIISVSYTADLELARKL